MGHAEETMQATPESTMSKFTVKYDGEALRTHEMDVKQLAPALLAVSKAFDRTQEHAAPGSRVALKAKATREGSFNIDLILYVVNEIEDIFTGNHMNAVVNAATIGGIFIGAVKYAKHIISHGGNPKETKDAGTDANGIKLSEATFPDGTKLITSEISMELLRDEEFLKSLKASTAPALADGLDSVTFDSDGDAETVDAETADGIAGYSPVEAVVETSAVEMVVQALDLSFRDDGKWRVTDGIKTQFVRLEDEAFIKRINDGEESFRKGDIYKVLMRVEKGFDEDRRLTVRYVAVEEVKEHRRVAEQQSLF